MRSQRYIKEGKVMKTKLVLGIWACCLLVSACGQTGKQSQPQLASEELRQELRQRVEKYWQARMNEDVFVTYQMERPSFQEKTPSKLYVKLFGSYNPLKDFSIREIVINDKQGQVRLENTLILRYARGKVVREKKSTLEDEWVYENGQWYHIFKRIY
jgi:glucan-binding YG repeat protein